MAAPTQYRQWVRQELAGELQETYPGAFSAADLKAVVHYPDRSLQYLGNLAALSISTHRDAFPVTSLAHVGPRGWTRGHRMTAGTLLFHTLDRGAFQYGRGRQFEQSSGRSTVGAAHPDSLPLFDIQLTYVNESGHLSYEALYGIVLLDMGKTISLESLQPFEQYSYLARDYQALTPLTAVPNPGLVLTRSPNRERLPLRSNQAGYRGEFDAGVSPVTIG